MKTVVFPALAVAGAYFGFVIGAGFTSGQEILQYFASHGYGMFLTVGVYLLVAVFLTPEFMRTGHRERFPTQDGIYKYYCGKVVGTFYDWFAHIFLFSSFVIMLSASGATLHQYFGVPSLAGTWITAALAAFVAILGFSRVADLLSKFGGVLVIAMIVVCVASIFTSTSSFSEGVTAMAGMDVISASDSWFMSAINYIGFSIFWAAPFLAKFSKTIESRKVAVAGQTLGEIILSAVTVVISIALIMNITVIEGSQVPVLKLATELSTGLGGVFAVLMCLAIFSTAVPLLSLSTSRLVPEGHPRAPLGYLVMGTVGALCASLLPFDQLMNYIYVINGYVGFIFMFFVIVKVARRRFARTPLVQVPTSAPK